MSGSGLGAAAPAPANTAPVILAADGITRRFDAVVALAGASIELRAGEVHGLVGDNGAGKSTLLKVISGVIAPDSGRILLDGREVRFHGPRDALAAGIETVYQDLALVDTMTAVQNVFLGREELSGLGVLRALRFVDDRRMRGRAREVLDQLGVGVPSLNADTRSMSGGQRQSLAIARAVLWGRRIVILDEPTAALGVRETQQVLELIGRLREHGIGVIVVSHNIEQLTQVADRITVMRLGRSIATRVVRETDAQQIVGLITGAIAPEGDPSDRAVSG